MRGKFVVIFAMMLGGFAQAQITPVQQALEYLAESGAAQDSEADLVQLAENLNFLENNPIHLNTATADDLTQLPMLNSFLAFAFLEYRWRSGRILSYYQLADIDGFTPELIEILEPFTTLAYPRKTTLWPKEFKHQIALQYRRVVQQQSGYANQNYLGDANAFYFRYRLEGDGKMFFGITAQKDPGEDYLVNNLPDFTSVHFSYKFNKTVKQIFLGDYSASFGQGLVLWSSFGFGKTSEAVTIQRFGQGLRHYTGADENRFLRGGAISLQKGNFEWQLFYSKNKVDANLENRQQDFEATSLQNSGYHRTANELADKDAQQLQMAGSYLQWRPKRLRIGFLATQTHFEHPIKYSEGIENAQRFQGQDAFHTSLDWKWLYGRIYLFGEAGMEWSRQAGAINAGMQINAADGLQWVVHTRYISPKWFSAYSQPFSETGREGEQGVYFGMNWRLPHQLSLSAFADFFKYLWPRLNVDRPGTGQDYMAQLNFMPRNFSTYVRVRYQSRLKRETSDLIIAKNTPEKRLGLRWHGNFPVHSKFRLNARIEMAHTRHGAAPETGWTSFVGGSFRPSEKWTFKARFVLLNTPGYSTAMWAFEDDVPYTFSVPAYYNTGHRWYLVSKFEPIQRLEFWLRFSNLKYENVAEIGSGNDAIKGSFRSEIKALVRYKF